MELNDELKGLVCLYCSSNETYPIQVRKNKGVEKAIYKCKSCKRKFTPDNGFKKFRHNPVAIKTAVEMLGKELSLSQVAYYLNQSFGINVTRKTLLDWKNKFGGL